MDITQEIVDSLQQGEETRKKGRKPALFRVQTLRDAAVPYSSKPMGDSPQTVAKYLREAVVPSDRFDADAENFVVLFLSTRRKIEGHAFLSRGTLDTILIHPRDVFRLAIVANAAAIVLCHNHPSGDPMPSDADMRVTRELVKAGQLLKIEVLDHIILGSETHASLRELGYFYV